MVASKDLGDGHAFVFGFVGEHGAFDHITNGVDAVDVGFPMIIGLT